jgi:hypothetical protein
VSEGVSEIQQCALALLALVAADYGGLDLARAADDVCESRGVSGQ